jgi:SAM-dependent methyltransferase
VICIGGCFLRRYGETGGIKPMLMKTLARSLVMSCVAVAMMIGSAAAQDAAPPKPQPGLPGKDVIWLPTAQALVDRMLDMAKVTVDDYVIDLGSGDGRTVITAARRGAKALGIEYNPDLVTFSRANAVAAGVEDRATFVEGDIFKSDFSAATVVTLFLLTDLNLQLRPTLLEMKPNTRIVSNTFDMHDWTPDDRVSVTTATGCTSYCHAYFWIVPAKVAGTWQMPEGELVLQQRFQMLSGTLKSPRGATEISEGRMRGDQITFKVGDRIYRGKVTDNRMEGVFGTETGFKASRR